MNVVHRIHRRPDRWSSPHERARIRAAERLDQPLEPSEEEWLDRHLAECGACAAVAADYRMQQKSFAALRAGPAPLPPRDLWARTAAAIEQEAARSAVTGGPPPRRRRLSAVPLGALSGALVVAVVVGVSLLPRSSPIVVPTDDVAQASPTPAPPSEAPLPTPWLVQAGNVAFLRLDENGRFGLVTAEVGEVCPPQEKAACAPLDETRRQTLPQVDAPSTVVLSPDLDQLVLVEEADDGSGGTIFALAVPTPETSPGPGSTTAPTATGSPGTGSVASPPPATPLPTGTPVATASAVPTAPGASAPPDPSPSLDASPPPDPSPSASVDPDEPAAIASGVVLVGNSAAYSPDGAWFAFSARPADGGHGPDIYLWRVGDPEALPVTDDHRSMFAGWLGSSILGSRVAGHADGQPADADDPAAPDASATAEPGEPDAKRFRPESFLVDAETGEERALEDGRLWLPSVDPSGRAAVYWDGTLELDETDMIWRPAVGRLVLGTWTEPRPEADADDGEAVADAAAVGRPIPPRLNRSRTVADSRVQVLQAGRLSEWDARWNPSGTHLAVWIADAADPAIGRLSLYSIDPASGRIDRPEGLLKDVPALPGFSIADGRLAWATPPGQDGQGSRIQVLAWTDEGVGQVETAPGDEVIVIR